LKSSMHLIVQLSSECNLRCEYCYVLASRVTRRTMKPTEAEILVRHASREYDSVHFCWHGGEPLLADISFLENVVRVQEEISCKTGTKFRNVIQTNGTLLSDTWLDFFARHKFSIGISFDAPPDVHSYNRPYANGSPSTQDTLEAVKRLQRHKLDLAALCVVTKRNVLRGEEIFEFFRSVRARVYSLLPVMVPPDSQVEAPSNEELFTLYRTTFELWLTERNGFHKIQPVDAIVRMLLGARPSRCSYSSPCLKRMISIAPNGDVLPCGSFTAREFVLGNIFQRPLLMILSSQKCKDLAQKKVKLVHQACKGCEFVSICRGGCREAAYWSTGAYDGLYPYCDARKLTFKYVQSRLHEILVDSSDREKAVGKMSKH
jgi:uncharacterized protein